MALIRKILDYLVSLRIVIPMLLVAVGASLIGTVLPEQDIFRSFWYLALLALLAFSLLVITLDRIPLIVATRGRYQMIGVATIHAGILVILAGVIYGNVAEFRYQARLIEGEPVVVPGLPFVIELERFEEEEYPAGTFAHKTLTILPRERQDSTLALYRKGEFSQRVVAGPANPVDVDGFTLLPSLNNFGWYFDLIVIMPDGRRRVVPFPPWAPPTIPIGDRKITAHRMADMSVPVAQLFELRGEIPVALGTVSSKKSVDVGGYKFTTSEFRRFTGVLIYRRPQMPLLMCGCLLTFAGLAWHFYHRNRTGTWDRGRRMADG